MLCLRGAMFKNVHSDVTSSLGCCRYGEVPLIPGQKSPYELAMLDKAKSDDLLREDNMDAAVDHALMRCLDPQEHPNTCAVASIVTSTRYVAPTDDIWQRLLRVVWCRQ